MLTSNSELLTAQERELLSQSFHPQRLRRRIQGILLSTFAVLGGIFALSQFGFTVVWFATVAIAVLIISTIEKVTYHKAMQSYEALIIKLTHRVETLEGQPQTPENGEPCQELVEASRSPAL